MYHSGCPEKNTHKRPSRWNTILELRALARYTARPRLHCRENRLHLTHTPLASICCGFVVRHAIQQVHSSIVMEFAPVRGIEQIRLAKNTHQTTTTTTLMMIASVKYNYRKLCRPSADILCSRQPYL